jgi:3-oxoacyl-[acyl-carrier protein] reductase
MKCALVTGGSRGIGRSVCLKMAAMGYYVLVNYKSNKDEADKTLALIKEKGGDGELLQFDVSLKEKIQEVLGKWIETNENNFIEILVNNAGIKDDGLMIFMKDEQWDNVIRTNLDGFFYVTRLVLNNMLMKKYGRIINVVSLIAGNDSRKTIWFTGRSCTRSWIFSIAGSRIYYGRNDFR